MLNPNRRTVLTVSPTDFRCIAGGGAVTGRAAM